MKIFLLLWAAALVGFLFGWIVRARLTKAQEDLETLKRLTE